MTFVDLLDADQQPALAPIPWKRLIPLTVALALFVLVMTIVAWMTPLRNPVEGSAETTFARAMAAHHAQAVEMALILRDRSADAELRQFALDITLTQQTQIGRMEGWLAVWGLALSGPAAGAHDTMPGMATQADVNALRALPIPEMETAFLQLMIRHHAGGVQMAQDVLRQTDRREVTQLAQAIVAAQQNEIDYMQSLLRTRGAALVPPVPTMPAMEHSKRQQP